MPRSVLRSLVFLGLAAACAPGGTPSPGPTADAGAVDAYTVPALPEAAPISREEYARRRAALAAAMGDGVFIAPGAPPPEHDYLPFAQEPNFLYLTGITEPGASLVITKRDGAVTERLFVLRRDPSREVWEGERLGAEGAEARTGIPSLTADRLLASLDSLVAPGGTLYAPTPLRRTDDPLVVAGPQQQVLGGIARRYGAEVVSLQAELRRLRGTKSPAELDLINRAVQITNLAHRAAMRTVAPGMNEFEIQALIEYTFRRNGADRPAFASIVGSGPNATTLHYNANDRFMAAEDVVVMDIGASYRGYAADVTRTIPVDGTYSTEQRQIYEIVLAAQKAAESLASAGTPWSELYAAAQRELATGLAELGLIDAPDATYDCARGACPQLALFFMHGLGHGIGLQVHDPDAYEFGALAVGSAFSIEPGIYVRRDALDHLPDTPGNREMIGRLAPLVARYRDIGVRIEDDYRITEAGLERMSAGAPREIEEIETLMRLPAVGAAEREAAVVEWYRQTQPR